MNGRDPLEEQLARLRPAAPSRRLMAQLAAARPQRPPFRWQLLLLRLAFPAAAATAIVLLVYARPRPAPIPSRPEQRDYYPAQFDSVLLGTRDLGIARDAAGEVYRLVACSTFEREAYRTHQDDSRLEIVQTTDHIIPIKLEIY